MTQEIVIFDLETGGLEKRPSLLTRSTHAALAARGRAPEPFVVFDAQAGWDDWVYCPGNPIIQIAALAVDAETWEPVAEPFEVKLLFRPELAAAEALEKNSYDPDAWAKEAVKYPEGLLRFGVYLGNHKTLELVSKAGRPYRVAQLAGHNAAGFDLEFLLRSFEDPIWQRFALPGDAPRSEPPRSMFFPGSFSVLDTLHLARWWAHIVSERVREPLGLDNFRLETLTAHFGIEHDAHDALGDVLATAEVARAMLRELR